MPIFTVNLKLEDRCPFLSYQGNKRAKTAVKMALLTLLLTDAETTYQPLWMFLVLLPQTPNSNRKVLVPGGATSDETLVMILNEGKTTDKQRDSGIGRLLRIVLLSSL